MSPHAPSDHLRMTQSRLTRLVLVALAVIALATAGIVANYLLLGYGDPQDDPVGKLGSSVELSRPAVPTPTPTDEGRREGDEHEEPDD